MNDRKEVQSDLKLEPKSPLITATIFSQPNPVAGVTREQSDRAISANSVAENKKIAEVFHKINCVIVENLMTYVTARSSVTARTHGDAYETDLLKNSQRNHKIALASAEIHKHLTGCNIFLMSTPNYRNYKESDFHHLYLYKDEKGVFYQINKEIHYLNNDTASLFKAIHFDQSKDPFSFNDNHICEIVLDSTFEKGHTNLSIGFKECVYLMITSPEASTYSYYKKEYLAKAAFAIGVLEMQGFYQPGRYWPNKNTLPPVSTRVVDGYIEKFPKIAEEYLNMAVDLGYTDALTWLRAIYACAIEYATKYDKNPAIIPALSAKKLELTKKQRRILEDDYSKAETFTHDFTRKTHNTPAGIQASLALSDFYSGEDLAEPARLHGFRRIDLADAICKPERIGTALYILASLSLEGCEIMIDRMENLYKRWQADRIVDLNDRDDMDFREHYKQYKQHFAKQYPDNVTLQVLNKVFAREISNCCKTEWVKWMLELGYPINCPLKQDEGDKPENGDRFIHFAAYIKDIELAEYLITQGADPQLRGSGGRTVAEIIGPLDRLPENERRWWESERIRWEKVINHVPQRADDLLDSNSPSLQPKTQSTTDQSTNTSPLEQKNNSVETVSAKRVGFV